MAVLCLFSVQYSSTFVPSYGRIGFPPVVPSNIWSLPLLSAEFQRETFLSGILDRWEVLKIDLNLKTSLIGVFF